MNNNKLYCILIVDFKCLDKLYCYAFAGLGIKDIPVRIRIAPLVFQKTSSWFIQYFDKKIVTISPTPVIAQYNDAYDSEKENNMLQQWLQIYLNVS